MPKWEYELVEIKREDIPELTNVSQESAINTQLNRLVAEGWEIIESNIHMARANEPVILLLRREKSTTIGFSS